jgi:DNA-binding IclR family transcriptional regulator
MGHVALEERNAWEKICEMGSARPADLADATGVPREAAERILEILWRRRLIIRQESGYFPVREAMGGRSAAALLTTDGGTSGGSGVEVS